jgi:hypothetical protein
MKKRISFAIAYDFDGTLASGNMQERDFIPAIGTNSKKFWDEVVSEQKKHEADNILIYMKLMLDKARTHEVQVRKKDFMDFGKKLDFFEGILPYKNGRKQEQGWFDRITEYAKQSGVTLDHYVVSSGIREMVAGTPIARKFRAIFASSFCYDHHGVAAWPALALNYTSKTQYLFRINKGCLSVCENILINKYVPDLERPVPFRNMIYIGDGDTDVPCFRVVKDKGGHSIAVYRSHTRGAKNKAENLIRDGRVNFVVTADYKNGSGLDRIIKGIIDKVAGDEHLRALGK